MSSAADRLQWTDTHAHLAEERIAGDLTAVLRRAAGAGVGQVIAVGTTAADSGRVATLAETIPGLFSTAGIHPNHAAEAEPTDWDEVVALASRRVVVAIGETGLDRHWNFTPFASQVEWFERHIELAIATDRPLVIHCRNCEADIIGQLERHRGRFRGVLHSFTGGGADADSFLDLGLHLSFAGMITYKGSKSDPLRRVAATVPPDRILLETDSPYLPPHPHRGRTNEPSLIVHTAAVLGELRGVSPEELARLTTANAQRLFGLDAHNQLIGE